MKNDFRAGKCKMYFQTFFQIFNSTFSISTFSSLLHLSLLLAFASQIGCATPEHDRQVYVAPELLEQFDNFRYEARSHALNVEIVDIIVVFGAMDEDDVIGYCWTRDNMTPVVVISQDFWQDASYYEQEMLMFHELGHCLLGKDHDNRIDHNGMAYSIMNEYMFNVYYYEANREDYLQQFFGHDRL